MGIEDPPTEDGATPKPYDNCASAAFKSSRPTQSWGWLRDQDKWTRCQHLKFWWDTNEISTPWYTSANVQFRPMSIMGQAIPNNENSFDEFQLLDGKVNSAKKQYVNLTFYSVLSDDRNKTVADHDLLSSRAWTYKDGEYIRDHVSCIKNNEYAEAMNKIRLVIWTLKYVSILYSYSTFQMFLVLFLLLRTAN